jgi:hypothetical protein
MEVTTWIKPRRGKMQDVKTVAVIEPMIKF